MDEKRRPELPTPIYTPIPIQEETEIEIELEPEPVFQLSEEERQKLARETKLDRFRTIVKDKFPNVVFEENLDFIEKFLNKPRCTICRSFYSQSTISDIKSKIRGEKQAFSQPFMLRLYKNSAEKCEDSKGYCCVSLLNNPSPNTHTKTLIPVPDMSLCSDWVLDHDFNSYIISFREILNEKKTEENKILEKKRIALEQKERAEQVIKEYNENYQEE